MGHLIKLVLPRVGNLTGKFVPMVGRFECAEWDQVCFAARVRVSGECLFTVFSLKSVGLVGCLFISELDFLEKGAVLFSKKSCSTLCRFGND